jgi:hypothetical protein
MDSDSPEMLEARFRALEALQSGGESISGFNQLQAVLELKDVPQTFKQVVDFAHYAATCHEASRWAEVGASLVMVAQSYLWWKFGVKPTLRDAEQWLELNIQNKAIMLLEPAQYQLRVGDTIRCAYRSNPVNVYPGPAMKHWISTTDDVMPLDSDPAALTLDPLYGLVLPEGCDPEDLTFSPWEHEGVMFGRAITPDQAMMPGWFWDLYPEAGVGEIIQPLSSTKRALVLNPPLRTMWELIGWSWLADWFGTFGKTLGRLEKAISGMHIRCAFEELWACDRWRVRPSWPKPKLLSTHSLSVEAIPDVSIEPFVKPYYINQTGWWIWVELNPGCHYTLSSNWTLKTDRATPDGGAEHVLVSRDKISKPRIPPVVFNAQVDATKILISGALMIGRLNRLVAAFMKKRPNYNKRIRDVQRFIKLLKRT